ncbi:POT family proton-dependent oligopeptide transporter [Flavobacterium arsenatis]|uniref:POT family proton-dependent oligopeptide transporter n=1 Tax=Flavobacterium arsenatis TaxID=1484332 RepID=A0ABU1TLT1_9FLAO|nr:peptide MFS transporter [Flavobacterium arsenatis]MDR6966383.1 POT family proton-dependent oligopeptide transporter [Flavobacterium arsenatis]
MTTEAGNPDFFKSKVLGHPSGLFVLFFTEMWERFSFYGMRVLLILFLTAALTGDNPGWGWSAENAGALYGTYAMLLYITPIFGGIIADRFIGYRWAVVIGSIIMTLGHAAMALDTPFMLYLGLGLLVIGTGFFKPNMTSILSEMYKLFPEKKDGAYTIFYMGVNAGAFFGMMLCGYLAANLGWHWGFGLAGIFMLLGTIQFWLAKPLFGDIGEVPSKQKKAEESARVALSKNEDDKPNPYTTVDFILIAVTTVIGLLYAFNDPLSKIGGINLFNFKIGSLDGSIFMILVALFLFLYLVISRLMRYTTIVRHRMIAVIIFAFFTVFFWMSFEQGASSLVIFARDNVDRTLEGSSLTIFNTINTLLTVVPLVIISWVLILLAKQTWKKALVSNVVLAITFLIIWGIAIWMLNNEFSKEASEIDPSWFSILNSFFIIAFASTVSKLWDSKYNPPAAVKYGLGLIIMAIGFGLLAFGSYGVATGIKVSMLWLVLAYLFHTLGELFLSPVGLSYVSKLVPARMIAFMFGMWYLAIAIGNKLAAVLGGQIENITNEYSLSTFFLIFTIVPAVAGLLVISLNPILKKLMHGVR